MISLGEAGPARRAARPVCAAVLATMLATMLGGCLGEGGGLGFLARAGDGGADAAPAPLSEAALAGGKVVVRGARGYCVDPRTLRRGAGSGFALIASCNSLSGAYERADVEPVVMTVQVQSGLLRKEAPDAAGMEAALAPERALQRVDGDGISLVHMAGGGDKGLPAGDPRHWRGAMMINGYLVGLAVYAPKGSDAAGAGGRALILQLAENLREASPVEMHRPEDKPAAVQRAAPGAVASAG